MASNKETKDVLKQLNTDDKTGLSTIEANKRLKENGPNAIAEDKHTSPFVLFLKGLIEPLSLILIFTAIISLSIELFVNQHANLIEFSVIIFIVVVNALIQTIEEIKAHNSIDALKKMTISKSTIIRDGQTLEVENKELVTGDIVLLEAGKFVPADIRIFNANHLQIDESALTGESQSVNKTSDALKTTKILGDQKNMAFMSTFVTNGRGVGVVVRTGLQTEMGKISTEIKNVDKRKTPLEEKISRFTKQLSVIALAIAAFVFAYFLIVDLTGWTEYILTSATIAIAFIPECLMVIISVILSVSSKRMAKQNAIVKNLDAIETLGAVNVICSDKTGTLTQNKMTVVDAIVNGQKVDPSKINFEDNKHFINANVLCNDSVNFNDEKIGDPTEIALINFTKQYIGSELEYRNTFKRISEKPFDSDRKLMSTLNNVGDKKVVYAKGAFDNLIKLSNKILINGKVEDLTQKHIDLYHKHSESFSNNALRVIGFGYKVVEENEYTEDNFIFLGIIGMIDPPREDIEETVKIAKDAGINIIMITGDHLLTAKAIAKNIGIYNDDNLAFSGTDLDNMSDEELLDKLDNIKVLARVNPNHKTRIVKLLQSQNKVVSMTGDGVNDAPSLAQADLGIAMGITGTDVSKDAANMVLQDDNFATIVKGIDEGRNVFQTIKRCLMFVLAANIPSVLIFAMVTFITGTSPFEAVNILWFNLIIETILAVALAFANKDKTLMKNKPRDRKESLFKGTYLELIFLVIIVSISGLSVYFIGSEVFGNVVLARNSTILITASSPAFYVLLIRLPNYQDKKSSIKINKVLIGGSVLALILNCFVIFTPFVNKIFLASATYESISGYTSPVTWQMALIVMGFIILTSLSYFVLQQIRWKIKR